MGMKIRQARETLGWSQVELARHLEKNQSTIAKYELGHEAIRSTDLPKLAQILGVPISYFFGELVVEENLSQVVKKLNESNRKTLLDMAEIYLRMQERHMQDDT